jgi:hypothetical protein
VLGELPVVEPSMRVLLVIYRPGGEGDVHSA